MDELNDKGFRVLAIAQKSNPSPVGAFGVKDECDMVLIGYLAFLDPPKESTDVFAKLTPDQKARVVSALRENGHTVGFMGDGINDAAAMKSADIGISVDTAVDVAKESADIILLEKDLMVLERARSNSAAVYGDVPGRLVCRIHVEPDAVYSHDSYPEAAFYPEPCVCSLMLGL